MDLDGVLVGVLPPRAILMSHTVSAAKKLDMSGSRIRAVREANRTTALTSRMTYKSRVDPIRTSGAKLAHLRIQSVAASELT